MIERPSVSPDTIQAFIKARQHESDDQFWKALITEELIQLKTRNLKLAHLAALTVRDGPIFLNPFNTNSYSKGFFGMHQLARTSGMYTDIHDHAFVDYTTELLVQLQKGKPMFLKWMEDGVNQHAPGALDAIDDTLHTVRFVVDGPEEVPNIHRPEMVWGAADVLLPIAYQLKIFPSS